MIYILMGVSGSGKTTIGNMLSERTGLPYYDADDYHPVGNLRKMAAGLPLTDLDREPWLENLSRAMQHWILSGDAILGCSALKESYRQKLAAPGVDIQWIWLHAEPDVISQRLEAREEHFFPPGLLQSQFNSLEPPAYGWKYHVEQDPGTIVEAIVKRMQIATAYSDTGLAGLGAMGQNLVLNMARSGLSVSAYNRQVPGMEEDIADDFVRSNAAEDKIMPFSEIGSFVQSIKTPRTIFLMIKAGSAVDNTIAQLMPFLGGGDTLVDLGNSHWRDTERRAAMLTARGIGYVGCGVSGGTEGALKGPSVMPGGPEAAVNDLLPLLGKIAAKDKNGLPCVANVGPGGAGHYVKMVHNGIEYGEMQLIADIYGILRTGAGLPAQEIARVFENWHNGRSASYLLEVTIAVLRMREGDVPVVDLIRDTASHKGTGQWTVESALQLGIACPTIYSALATRQVSAQKALRVEVSEVYGRTSADYAPETATLEQALYAARVINHASGFHMLSAASEQYGWSLDLPEIARIWTNGCIIRSNLMVDLVDILSTCEDYLLLCQTISSELNSLIAPLRTITADCAQKGLPVPALASALIYFDQMRTSTMSTNLIQGQRDFFGHHGFQRTDDQGDELYHL